MLAHSLISVLQSFCLRVQHINEGAYHHPKMDNGENIRPYIHMIVKHVISSRAVKSEKQNLRLCSHDTRTFWKL